MIQVKVISVYIKDLENIINSTIKDIYENNPNNNVSINDIKLIGGEFTKTVIIFYDIKVDLNK